MKILLSVTILLATLATLQAQSAGGEYYRILSQNSQQLVLEFDFTDIMLEQVPLSGEGSWQFEIPGLPLNYESGRPLLPVLVVPLVLPDADLVTNHHVEHYQQMPGAFPALFVDVPNDPQKATAVAPKSVLPPAANAKKIGAEPANRTPVQRAAGLNGSADVAFREQFPEQFVRLNEVGTFRDYELYSLAIYPLQVNSMGTVFYEKFTVTVNFRNARLPFQSMPTAEADILRSFVANREQLNLAAPRQAPPVMMAPNDFNSTPDQRARIIVNEDGLYKVSGSDLELAAIDLAELDPATLRLTNKGNQVAIYLVGDEDDVFDLEDFFEFWGERNERTFVDQYPDQYADPFSDENVYWLEWGGAAGMRMIEENGNIETSTQGQFNPSFYFNNTLHVEENVHFARLGQGSLDQLSYKRDLWYFDSGIKAVGKKQYFFELQHPDPSSFNPVFVDVMFSGQSFGAALNNTQVPHDVMVWLNNGFVGSDNNSWFNQDTARIHNRANSTLRTSNLLNGTNTLEVQLPTLPDIGDPAAPTKGTDIVLLNWFEITYDRLYRATDNKIEFTRPAFIPFPAIDLFQFDVDGFTASNIDIYKKGISKIVNFDILEEIIDGETNFKVVFQDNVLSDGVEYVALTGGQKKTPLRIVRDKPFDANDPQRLLRDTDNAAEYIIITHDRFFNNAQPLVDYRRSKGAVVEMVDVQEIYDEFNSGIKSPLAIQEFLRYAFFNWSRTPRLKYVLLLGGANFNYKSTSATSPDLVPTFFVQTQEFGASATDLPFALISGGESDLVPDIFIGRLPVATNSDVSAVIDKIIEYEEAAPAGEWRNSALFISGNDVLTNEAPSGLPHAFRTQNSRLMESLIPQHFTGKRLNTVQDTSLSFDPDFGNVTDLVDHWNDGLVYINFVGHGGGGIWADAGLMELQDVARLTNQGQYPFITSMTCFTGAFENPTKPGLAQALVLAEDKGAAGVFASSGLGYLHNDYSMLWYVAQQMFESELRIGDIIGIGKILYASFGGDYNVDGTIYPTPGYGAVKTEMLHQYNLVGDPFLKFRVPPAAIEVSLSDANPQRGESIDVTIETGLASADGYIELVDNKLKIIDREFVFGAGQTETIQVNIPDDFPEGTGLVRVYLENGSEDAGGSARIGVNYAVVQNIEFQPAQPDVDDSVLVFLEVEDQLGVERVYIIPEFAFGNQPPDTIIAEEIPGSPGTYLGQFDPTFRLQSVFFNIYVENSLGNTSVFKNLNYTVTDIRPDIRFIPGTLRFGGTRHAQLKIGVENPAGAGEDNNVQVKVSFFDGEKNLINGSPFTTTQVNLASADSVTAAARFTLPFNRTIYDIRAVVEVDPTEDVVDFNPANDSLTQLLFPSIYNVSASGSDTISLGAAKVFFPPGSVSDSSAVLARLVEFKAPRDQAGLLPVNLLNDEELHAAEIRLLNPAVALNTPFHLQMELNPTLFDTSAYPTTQVKLYEKTADARPWIFISTVLNEADNTLFTYPAGQGLYAPFISDDVKAPRIEMTVDGRPLVDRGLVKPNPSLYLLVQDESGINLARDRVIINLNNQDIPEDKIFIPDSVQQNSVVGVTIYPDLDIGSHDLSVTVEDVNGNTSEASFELVVNNEFDIHVYGNYPNPFSVRTIFSYFVVAETSLDELQVRLYTVSGRLIRVIDSDINNLVDAIDDGARRQGYNELIWDGTDDQGNEVANGVYFALIRGSLDGEIVEKILKVAKLE